MILAPLIWMTPPLPHPAVWYMTCVATSAHAAADAQADDATVVGNIEKDCGFIADKAAAQMVEDWKVSGLAERDEREFAVKITGEVAENSRLLKMAARVRALRIADMVRSENQSRPGDVR